VDLVRHGIEAIGGKYPEFRRERSPEQFVQEAVATARVKAREFFAYQETWRRALAAARPCGPERMAPFKV